MPIDAEQWRAQTGLFCASRVLLRPPRYKQPKPKAQANTLSLNMKFSLAVLLVTLRTGVFYASRTLHLLWLIACHTSRLLSSIVRLSCKRLRGVSVLLCLCLVVVEMLLIMSGDVEENPGPPKIQASALKDVLKELWGVSSKWFNIGLALSVPFGSLNSIKSQYPDVRDCLREMLQLWLTSTSPDPTWEALVDALDSCIVEEGQLAAGLRAKYCRMQYQQVDSIQQLWHPLADREERPTPRPPIYGPVPLPPVHSPVDQYASYLRSVYLRDKLPTYAKWPPTASKKYIHLAVVKKEKVSKKQADEFTKATLHGTEIDDIYRKKKAMNFSDIGKTEHGLPAKLILVEGAAGIGKTTFAWKVCRKWAKGKILRDYGLVVLLRLRDKRVRGAQSFLDLFYHPDPEICTAVAREIQYHQGRSVLLLFEGYDELPGKLQTQKSVFLDVLYGCCLSESAVLITSRPSATKFLNWQFRHAISQHIEILGFTRDDITSYVTSVVKEEKMRENFLQYLQCYPYIQGMMYVPLNAVIVTEVYKDSQQSPEKFIPTTMTELYTSLTQSLLLRYLHSHSEYGLQEWSLNCFSDLPKELYDQFCLICEIALNGMIEDEFVFENLPVDFNTLDLMQSVPELYIDRGSVVSYNFFHLTLQEYLAAVNISQQSIERQLEFFCTSVPQRNRLQLLSHKPQPGVAQNCTIDSLPFQPPPHPPVSHEGAPSEQVISSTPPQPLHPNPNAQPVVPQMYASHSPPSFPPVSPSHTQSEDDVHSKLTPPTPPQTITPFHPPHPPFTLERPAVPSYYPPTVAPLRTPKQCYGNPPHSVPSQKQLEECIRAMRSLMSSRLSNTLRFLAGLTKYDNIALDSLRSLLFHDASDDVVRISLTSLHWFFEAQCIRTYSELVNTPCVQYSRNGRMTPFDCFVLGYAVSHITCNWKIDLTGHCIDDEGVEMFVAGLKFDKHSILKCDIVLLCLEDCELTSRGLGYLAQVVNDVVQNMTKLSLQANGFGEKEASVIAEMLKENRTLQQLNVSRNFIGQGGATALAEMLKENRTLQQLNVSVNYIGQGGATALAEMLKENRTLQQLNVSDNSIGQGGATALAEMLKENRILQQLDVSWNSIGQGGATALAEMLKENRTLQQLNVSHNSIGQGGATALAEMLKENRTLQQLDVSWNSIGQGGATAVAEMLKENRTLQQLDVSDNSIGQGGATALAEMLKENRTLQQLDVSDNSIGQGGATALAEMLKENRTLQQLNVSDNSIGQGGATALAEMLKENTICRVLAIGL